MSSLFTTRSLQANSAFTTRHLKDDSIVANTIITGDGQRVNVNDLLKGSDGYVTKDQMKKITNELQKNIQTNTKNIKANNTKISNTSKELQETNNKVQSFDSRITVNETDIDKLESDLTNHAKNNHLNNGRSISCYYNCSQNVLDTLGKSQTDSHNTYATNWIEDAVKKSYAAYYGLDIDVKPKISDHETRLATLETSGGNSSVTHIGDLNIKANGETIGFVNYDSHDVYDFKTLNELLEVVLPIIEDLLTRVHNLEYQ